MPAGERVLDVQPKLAARVRLLHTENTGKSDPGDALAVAVAALRSTTRREVIAGNHAMVLKVWAKGIVTCPGPATRPPAGCTPCCGAGARRGRGRDHRRPRSQDPRPDQASGPGRRARRELGAELLADIRHLDAQRREVKKKLATAVKASGTSLTEVFGVGPVIAATVIGDVVTVARFPTRDRFATYNGTAPTEVSSGEKKIYRLSRRGNRRLNHAIHMAAITQISHAHSQGRAYYQRKLAKGKTCQGSAALPETADQRRHLRPATRRRPHEGPGRATGEPLCLQGGRAHTPHTGSSGKPLPGPRPAYDPRQDTRPCRRPSVSEEGPESHLTTTKAKRIRSVCW